MPNEPTPEMRALVDETEAEIERIMALVEDGNITALEWENEMQPLLTQGHLTSWMLGQESPAMGVDDLLTTGTLIQLQLQYLSNFSDTIRTAPEFILGWFERAKMYASAMNQTYWSGRMKVWPLPAQPGQGTICLSNCRCEWRENIISFEDGDGDFYWELDRFVADEDHCQTCLQREDEWNPVQVRDGVLQI